MTAATGSAPTFEAPRTQTDGSSASITPSTLLAALGAVLSTGAIFGFFYAWIVSTVWGLDDTDPRVAIEAMQAMNASVRNAAFFPTFFLTPMFLGIAALAARRDGASRAVRFFAAAAVVYLVGGIMLTGLVNVPMNEELATVVIPDSIEAADVVWNDYSSTWQIWNITRTVFSGVALVLASMGLVSLGRR